MADKISVAEDAGMENKRGTKRPRDVDINDDVNIKVEEATTTKDDEEATTTKDDEIKVEETTATKDDEIKVVCDTLQDEDEAEPDNFIKRLDSKIETLKTRWKAYCETMKTGCEEIGAIVDRIEAGQTPAGIEATVKAGYDRSNCTKDPAEFLEYVRERMRPPPRI